MTPSAEEDLPIKDLLRFINHSHTVDHQETLGTVQQSMVRLGCDYIAVVDQLRVVGLCNRLQLETAMGVRSGYALCVQQPVRRHMLPEYLEITTRTPLNRVLGSVFGRGEDRFYDDVVLTDPKGDYLGLIRVRDLLRLQHRTHQQTIAQLKHKKRQLDAKNRRREKHLLLARQLQQAMLPQHFPVFTRDRITFIHRYQSADLLSGDFFYVIPLNPDCAGIFVCDVQGSGVGSALITSMIRALVDGHIKTNRSPGELLTIINAHFSRLMQNYPDSIFVTAAYLVVDLVLERYQLASAGHPVPILVDRGQDTCGLMPVPGETVGPPMGINADAVYETTESRLTGPQLFLLYTDGLYEVFGADHQPFGHSRLVDTIKRYAHLPTDALFRQVISRIETYSATDGFEDDMCLVGVDVNCQPQEEIESTPS